jgi:hypothetical protein
MFDFLCITYIIDNISTFGIASCSLLFLLWRDAQIAMNAAYKFHRQINEHTNDVFHCA